MRIVTTLLCFVLVSLCSCSPSRIASSNSPSPHERVMAWPKDWSGHLGQTVTLEGTAANAKLGALLQGEEDAIWIDGLTAWPEGFGASGNRGKHLCVSGTVIQKDDLPIFVQQPGALPRAGMPVQSAEALEKAQWRYLLKDATWTVLESGDICFSSAH